MNYRMIWQVLGRVLLCEAALLLIPMIAAACFAEALWPFGCTALVCALCAGLLLRIKPRFSGFYAKEGFVCVGLSWLVMSLFGCMPFLLSGSIPNFVDALFETISGFTTTGASILTNVEVLPYGMLLWRSVTQWIGGMGVLVFVMAVLPLAGGRAMHIMRAEVPGPTVGKLVPRMRRTATILYLIYIGLTLVEVGLLLAGGLDLYDAVLHAFSTASTGGFSSYAASAGAFNSLYVEMVISVFMLLFGVNFNLFFLLLLGRIRPALGNEELRWYLGIVTLSVLTIALDIRHQYAGLGEALRYSFFQVSSIITSTGYATADYNLWPEYSRCLLVLLMVVGACAGSTGGGLKISRLMIMFKSAGCEMQRLLRPNTVRCVRLDRRPVAMETVHETHVYVALYVVLILVGTLMLSLDDLDLNTNFSAAISCLSNIGPGLSMVGPMGNYSMFSDHSKLGLSLLMLLGRLEIYPILILLAPATWRKG